MLPPKKSVLAWTSIFLALAAQVSAFAPAAGKGRNGDDVSLVARKAPSIAQLAAKNKGKKTVFTACAKDSECQQGCCGFKTGKCAGPDVAQENGSGGCGHGNKSPNCDVATLLGFKNCIAGAKNGNLKAAATQQAAAFAAQLDKLPFKPAKRDIDDADESDDDDDDDSTASQPLEARKAPSIAQLAAKNKGKKTVFTACAKDSECQQGCCGFKTGKCAGPDVAQENGSGGCGRGNKSPNCDVATLLGFKNCIAGAKNGNLKAAATQQAAAFAAQLDKLPFKPSKRDTDDADDDADNDDSTASQPLEARKAPSIAQLAAKNKGKKTVFTACAKDSECQQGCCGFKTGKCAGPDVAQDNGSGGCGRGNKSPNCDVATLLGFKNCIAGAKNGNLKAAATQQAAAFAAQLDNLPFKPSKRDLADESVEELSRREVLQQGKFAPRLLKARETELELEAREDDDDEFDDDDDEFEEDQ